MSTLSPGRVVQSRLALLPDGKMGEVALDTRKNAWARWYDGSTWGQWFEVAGNAVDIAITAAAVGSPSATDTVYVIVTPDRPVIGGTQATRAVYSMTATGLTGTSL